MEIYWKYTLNHTEKYEVPIKFNLEVRNTWMDIITLSPVVIKCMYK